MTLENAIYNAIITWPSLYYMVDLSLSRLHVLNHYFLVMGSGKELAYTKDPKRGGYFVSARYGKQARKYDPPYDKIKVSKKIKEKINNGVRMYRIFPVDVRLTRFYSGNIEYATTPIFEDQNSPIDYPEIYSEKQGKAAEFCVEFYPIKKDSTWRPYPFSFYHLPFVEINPNYGKYNCQTISGMTIAELRESKSLIQEDWIAGIIEIFREALKWFEDDSNNFKAAKKYIQDCKKIIEAFS